MATHKTSGMSDAAHIKLKQLIWLASINLYLNYSMFAVMKSKSQYRLVWKINCSESLALQMNSSSAQGRITRGGLEGKANLASCDSTLVRLRCI